ncbi:MAG: hypothetical protein ACRDGL_04335 [Candidatus Limnocylindrales bacterium]
MHPHSGVLRPLTLAVGLCLLLSGVVDARAQVKPLVTSASITPSTQTTGANRYATWTASWAGSPPFSGYFEYGDARPNGTIPAYSYSKTFSETFPLLCITKQYTQTLWVSDDNGGRGYTSTTTVPARGC